MSKGLSFEISSTGHNSSVELVNSLKEEFSHEKHLHPDSWVWIDPSGTVHAPALAPEHIKEEKSSYEVTMKLFYLPSVPPAARTEHTEEAVRMTLEELGTDKIDSLIVSFPGVYFDANDEISTTTTEEDQDESIDEETQGFLHTYKVLAKLVHEGKVAKLGLSEFGTGRLRRLLKALHQDGPSGPVEQIRPKYVQINVRDCCVVPRELIIYAKREGIQLLTHNDCAEIVTREGIEGVVREGGVSDFCRKKITSDDGNQDMDVDMEQSESASPGKRKRDEEERAKWDLFPQFVVKYSAVDRDRSIIENKGCVYSPHLRKQPLTLPFPT